MYDGKKTKLIVIEVWKAIETASRIYLKIEDMNTFLEVQRVNLYMMNVEYIYF